MHAPEEARCKFCHSSIEDGVTYYSNIGVDPIEFCCMNADCVTQLPHDEDMPGGVDTMNTTWAYEDPARQVGTFGVSASKIHEEEERLFDDEQARLKRRILRRMHEREERGPIYERRL